MSLEIKEGYFSHTINAKFKSKKVFYFFYTPLNKNVYDVFTNEVVDENIDWSVGMIEQAKMFGNGWIGVSSNDGDKEINKEFVAYKHVGPYKGLMDAYKKVMKDYPKAKEFYNVYINNPKTTEEKDYITYILIG